MKLPNNYGAVSRLTGNRRRPYMVRKHIGNGRYHVIGYYETRAEALNALALYNRTTSTPAPCVTLATLYNEWLPIHATTLSPAGVAGYVQAYKHIASIATIPIDALAFKDFQTCIDNIQAGYATKKKARSLISQLCKYAIINDYPLKQYGAYITIGKHKPLRPHKVISRRTINALWARGTEASGALVLLYTGLRVGELLRLRKTDINLKSNYFIVRQAKTEAGTGRLVPIHPRIIPIVRQQYDTATSLLFPVTYAQFAREFKALTGGKHTTHDCRHTVATLLDRAGANPTAVRAILGHKHGDITTRVYTHKAVKDLKNAIKLLP